MQGGAGCRVCWCYHFVDMGMDASVHVNMSFDNIQTYSSPDRPLKSERRKKHVRRFLCMAASGEACCKHAFVKKTLLQFQRGNTLHF